MKQIKFLLVLFSIFFLSASLLAQETKEREFKFPGYTLDKCLKGYDIAKKSKRMVAASLTIGDYKDALQTKQFKNSVLAGVSVVAIPNSSEIFGRIRGVMILDVRKKSKAWAAGLRKDDIISSVNRRDVKNVEQFLDAFNNSKERVLLRVYRDGNSALVMVQ